MCVSLPQHVAVSSGSGSEDFTRLKEITAAISDLHYICLDVANGYSEHFVDFVRKTREELPKHTILVRTCLLSTG